MFCKGRRTESQNTGHENVLKLRNGVFAPSQMRTTKKQRSLAVITKEAAGEPTPDLVLATYDNRGFTYATETALAFLLAQDGTD